MGSIRILHMFPLDFEEFLWANNVGEWAVGEMRRCFEQQQPLTDALHGKMMDLFRRYLLVGGLPDAISLPTYPLVQNAGKNLLKLYMNDTGIFTGILYSNNIKPVLEDIRSINLGAVYENVVAQEISFH